jgi:hypothetical protein
MTEIIITKKHIANLKLSEGKKALKIHFFMGDKFCIIPLHEFKKPIGKVFEYIENIPEIVGEILPPQKGSGKIKLWRISIKTNMYYIKDTYIQLLLNESNLTLPIYEE